MSKFAVPNPDAMRFLPDQPNRARHRATANLCELHIAACRPHSHYLAGLDDIFGAELTVQGI